MVGHECTLLNCTACLKITRSAIMSGAIGRKGGREEGRKEGRERHQLFRLGNTPEWLIAALGREGQKGMGLYQRHQTGYSIVYDMKEEAARQIHFIGGRSLRPHTILSQRKRGDTQTNKKVTINRDESRRHHGVDTPPVILHILLFQENAQRGPWSNISFRTPQHNMQLFSKSINRGQHQLGTWAYIYT